MKRQAIEKLQNEKKGKDITNRAEKAMASSVAEQLIFFCEQDEEFAQAVVQGGSFAQCMAQVASGVGSALSDLEAYRRAVAFYFPGAKVSMHLNVDLVGEAGDGGRPMVAHTGGNLKKTAMLLDIGDFL